ncbi:MAG: DUF2442 domain-containing protein [Tannerellaceae bacterium]|nr:DUF2442 domain-containing protein [Tannerellaceae bacterium]
MFARSGEGLPQWSESPFGLHWENIDEDISFESFSWGDNDPQTLYHRSPPSPLPGGLTKKFV